MARWWGALPAHGQHDPFAPVAGVGDSACVDALVGAAGVLVHDVAAGAGRGGGAGRDMNAGAMPAKNIVATRINGHRLASGTSHSSAWLTGVSFISPSPLYCRRLAKTRSRGRDYLLLKIGDIPLSGAGRCEIICSSRSAGLEACQRAAQRGSAEGLRYETRRVRCRTTDRAARGR